MADEKQRRTIERAQKAAERQRKLLSKRKESQEEIARSMSTSVSTSGLSRIASSHIESSHDAVSMLHSSKNSSVDTSLQKSSTVKVDSTVDDDGKNTAVLAGQSLEMDRAECGEDESSELRSGSASNGLDSIKLNKSVSRDTLSKESESDPSLHTTKSIEIPKLPLQEGSVASSGLESTNTSLQQGSTTSALSSKKSLGSKRTVSFHDGI